ncbi:FAD-dependent oxidoreductase [Cellulosimicrobium terreum]|nr:FAD-dependent oxidoreductase [Cellulosimicrobium terreum]
MAHLDPGLPSSVLVVGAGLAGAQTVAGLRADGYTGAITVLGAEGVAPYDRPPLSKELLTRPGPAWLADEIGVDVTALADDVRLDDPAVRLEPTADGSARDGRAREHVVTTRSGARLTAEAVVLATGSVPVRPGAWDAARVLHTAADAAGLRPLVRAGVHLVIVGAGWIGAELAGVAAGAGASVTVVEAAPVPLARQLGDAVGTHLARWYAAAGVRLLAGVAVTAVRPDGVGLADGRDVPADVVLVAVGARPATAWLAGALPPDAFDAVGAIAVDATGAVPGFGGLWAVGDCATRAHPLLGAVPGGHWSSALHDPGPTARAILGLEPVAGPTHAPYVFSQQLGHDVALLGMPREGDVVVLRGDPTGGPSGRDGWAAFYLDPDDARTLGDAGAVSAPGARVPVRAILLADSPRDVGPVRKAVSRHGVVALDLDVALDPACRLRDALV